MSKVEPSIATGTKYNKNWNQVYNKKIWIKYTKIEQSLTKIENHLYTKNWTKYAKNWNEVYQKLKQSV